MRVSLIATMTNGKLTLHKNKLYEVSESLAEALLKAGVAVKGGFIHELDSKEYYPKEMHPGGEKI